MVVFRINLGGGDMSEPLFRPDGPEYEGMVSVGQLISLLRCYYAPAEPEYPLRQAGFGEWVKRGMLTEAHEITDRGKAYVHHLMGTPLPEKRESWVVPHRKA